MLSPFIDNHLSKHQTEPKVLYSYKNCLPSNQFQNYNDLIYNKNYKRHKWIIETCKVTGSKQCNKCARPLANTIFKLEYHYFNNSTLKINWVCELLISWDTSIQSYSHTECAIESRTETPIVAKFYFIFLFLKILQRSIQFRL